MIRRGYVLVGGWPGSGKTTLATALGAELGWPVLAKDEVKEALMDALGAPATVAESQRLGRAAVDVVLRLARGCPSAVVDSTWYARSLPLVRALSPCVEVRCVAPLDVVRERYATRERDPRHLDGQRDEAELWGAPVAPLGVGPLVEVETDRPVDVPALARELLERLA